jgi:hypothetical protein
MSLRAGTAQRPRSDPTTSFISAMMVLGCWGCFLEFPGAEKSRWGHAQQHNNLLKTAKGELSPFTHAERIHQRRVHTHTTTRTIKGIAQTERVGSRKTQHYGAVLHRSWLRKNKVGVHDS